MLATQLRKIHTIITHDAFDNRGTKAVFALECITFGDGVPRRSNALLVIADQRCVLNIALWQTADRRCAKTNQRLTGIGRVALKISMQVAGLSGNSEFIIRQCVVIKTDSDVSRTFEQIRNPLGLPMAFGAVR